MTRELPHNTQAEAGLLACCLIGGFDEVARCQSERINGDTFYSPAHRLVWEAICALADRKSAIDTILLTDELSSRHDLEAVGGVSFVESLAGSIETTAHLGHFIELLHGKQLLRRVIREASRIVEVGYETDARDAAEFLSTTEQSIHAIGLEQQTGAVIPIAAAVDTAVHDIARVISLGGQPEGLPTGYPDIDAIMMGMRASEMIVLAARPSVGKTSLAVNIAEHVVMPPRPAVAKQNVLIFSLEMSAAQIARRMICGTAAVKWDRIAGGFANHEDEQKLANSAIRWKQATAWIDESSGLTVSEIVARSRRLDARHRLGLVVVDYLQLIAGSNRRAPREEQIAEISSGLKGLAKELRIPVLALSQLNRESERDEREPRVSDLRGSGSQEQDADVVLLLSRADDTGDVVDVQIAKNRNGPTGRAKLTFIREYTRFANYAP